MSSKIPYFIILSKRPFHTVVDMLKNPDYAELHRKQMARELPPSVSPKVIPRACLHQTPDMLVEPYTDENGIPKNKFREEVIVAQADKSGRILIEREKPDLARRILRELRVIDKSIKLDELGCMLPEEDPDADKPRNLGGRPRKNVI